MMITNTMAVIISMMKHRRDLRQGEGEDVVVVEGEEEEGVEIRVPPRVVVAAAVVAGEMTMVPVPEEAAEEAEEPAGVTIISE